MISKLKHIKNLAGVFADYTWDTNLPAFKAFNLFYGWNGSGKTTLSRLFGAIGGLSILGLDYEIEDEEGKRYKQTDAFPRTIRVFNQDYIQRNVEVLKGRANSISILLGAENKELLEKIEADEKLLNGDPADPANSGSAAKLRECIEEKEQKEKERGRTFTDIAKTIGAAIGGNALRDYRKQQAEKDFLVLGADVELADGSLQSLLVSVKQESLPALSHPTLPTIKAQARGDEEFGLATFLGDARKQAEALLLKTVQSEVIARLATHPDLSGWVEEGIRLHEKHASTVCEYCLQEIPRSRTIQLARHFNEADKQLKKDLDSLHDKLNKAHALILAVELPDAARLYSESRTLFETARVNFQTEKQQVLSRITEIMAEVREKKSKSTQPLILKTQLHCEDLANRLADANKIIEEHNNITSYFERVKAEAIQKLKRHYLCTIFDDVKSLDADITRLHAEGESLNMEVDDIRKRISRNMASVSSQHKACESINEKLSTFLGYRELRFVPRLEKRRSEAASEIVAGYDILRGDKPALYLSEGEKTAIAFVYFVVHLGDQNFDPHNGIVLVDDPISSLDSNSLYQAFSFLKNSVQACQQVFVLTHNFDFLQLILNWRKRAGGGGYYMIKNRFLGDVRHAYIDKMDKEIYQYESEYHYLFKLLSQMKADQDGTISKAYPVPNIARKVWDTFLSFRVPNGESPYKKMEELKREGFDAQKLDAIYKFINDQSHITGSGFDPALVPEAKKVLDEIFEMMAKISPKHYEILSRSVAEA